MKMFRKMKGKLGFTLAEMLIVVAIIAILTAVAAPNVAKYSRGVKLRELDDSARAIYMAAEHKFMNEIEMGRELPDGAPVNADAVTKRYGSDASGISMSYLRNDDVKKLMSSGGADIENTGVFESQLFENYYIVEYDPKFGDVFGVFYSEDEDLLSYRDDYYPDIDELQKEHLIGYYGSDNVKPEEKTNSEVLPKPEVSIKNKEKLVLTITSPNFSNTENKVYIAVKICDAADNKKSVELIPRNGKIYMTPNKTVHFILDTLSDTLTDYTTSAELTDVNEMDELKVFEKPFSEWATDDFGNYLIDPGAKLDIYVTFYDDKGKSIDRTVKVSANSLFADSSSLTEADIEYGRHLQNLDKCSAVTTAVIKRTIDFSKTGLNEYESWASTYPGKKFVSLPFSSINISAVSGAEIRNIDFQGVDVYDDGTLYSGLFTWFSGEATNLVFRNPKSVGGSITGTLCGYGISTVVNNVTVINPKIECNNSGGGLIGMDSESVISNCAVYVAEDENYSWGDPNNDPYYHYTIVAENTDNYSGGLVGLTTLTTIKESYAAVKVSCEKGKAGGLVGFCSSETFIENSFSAGHTYYGIFEGNAKDGKEINLKDNVRGNIAGGIVSESQGDNEINIIGTVFSTCSVSGTTVDLAYNGTAVIKDGATVYTLGTAYLPDGTKTTKSSDERVKSADQVKDDALTNVGMRYDLKVSSAYKYPVPAGMTMHGDWPSSDAVTGFFYWEKEDRSGTDSYAVSALWYGKGQPEVLINTLCSAQDGNNITEYGYGAFTVGGSLDGSAVTFTDGTCTDVEDADAVSAIQTALAGAADLNVTDPTTITVKLYSVTTSSDKPLVKATVGGNEYTFAPDFYTIYASKDSVSVGTAEGVLGVRSEAHLAKVGSYLSEKFVQSHDIKPAAALTPIGTSSAPFTGAYDGGSYRIINAAISSNAASDYAGLFGRTDGAELENIVMFNEAATADEFDRNKIEGKTVGVIVAYAGNSDGSGSINNCVAAGYTVIGSENSGGIAGASACAINNCEANIRFGKVENCAGGIVGDGTSAAIDSCYALIHGIESPKSSMSLGGIAGKASAVTNCYVIFSGQTVGYPVANVSNNSTNYYVKEKGYYQGNPKYGNYGQRKSLNEMKITEMKVSDQISYSVQATNKDSDYEFKALVTDNVAHVPVHYGPMPPKAELDAETLTEGPLVGIFNVQCYSGDSGNYDGLMIYNRSGVLNWDENMQGVAAGSKHVGIFLANPEDEKIKANSYLILEGGIYSQYLSVYINDEDEKLDPSRFKEFGVTANPSYTAQSGYYRFGYSSIENGTKDDTGWIFDTFYLKGEPGVDANEAFMYYVICDKDGNEMTPEQIKSIEIKYENPDTKIKGSLLRSEIEKKSVKGTDHMAYIPGSMVDEWETPEMGAFVAGTNLGGSRDKNLPKYIYPYSMKLTTTKNGITTTAGDAFHYYNNGVLGVIIRSDQAEEILNGNIKFQVNSMPVDMVPWDEQMNADICNASALGLDGYEVFVVKEGEITPEEIGWGWPDFTAVYGSKLVFKYKCNVLTAETNNKTAEEYMPDFVLATLYANANGTNHYAKGFKAGAQIYPAQSAGSDHNSGDNPTSKTNSYVFLTTGSTKDFKIKINGNKFVDIGTNTDMVTNLTWDFFGNDTKAYTINILGDEVNTIEVYYKGELIMTKSAGEF